MQAFTIQTNGETKKGIRVERFEKTGAYQISVLKGRRPVFVPIFKRNQIVGEGPLGYQILEAGIWSDSQTGRVKLQNPKMMRGKPAETWLVCACILPKEQS